MDYLTNAVQIIEAHQALLGHDAHNWKRSALVVVTLNHFQKVHSQDFKDHHEVLAMRAMVQQAVQ